MTLTVVRIDTYQYEAVKFQVNSSAPLETGLADRQYRNSRTNGGRSFAILDTADYDAQFGY